MGFEEGSGRGIEKVNSLRSLPWGRPGNSGGDRELGEKKRSAGNDEVRHILEVEGFCELRAVAAEGSSRAVLEG